MIWGNEAAMKAGFKEKLAFEVHQGEDVLFWWSNLCELPIWTISVLKHWYIMLLTIML